MHRLATELDPHGVRVVRAVIALVEEEIERLLHAREAIADRGCPCTPLREIEEMPRLRERRLRAREALLDRRFFREERRGDLGDAEAGEHRQNERDLRLLRHLRMATREHHAELVVGRRLEGDGLDGSGLGVRVIAIQRLAPALPADDVERAVLRDLHEPRARVLRHAVDLPGLERAKERVLHDVLREREVVHTERPRERGEQPRRLTPEEMVDHIRKVGRTSTSPPTWRIGHPIESSIACARSLASTML